MPLLLIICFFLSFCNPKDDAPIAEEKPKPSPELPSEPIGDTTIRITMDQFIGANAFIDDPIDKLKAVGFIREYHNWSWNEGNGAANYPGFPNNAIQFAPSYPGWSFDDYYANLNKEGVAVAPCIQGAVNWLHGGPNFPGQNKPTDAPGLDPALASSYHAKAFFMYQYAARYGSKKVPEAQLSVSANQAKLSGLGVVKYLEDWNEQDKTWEGRDAEFKPEEYAAMASANYDGHGNTMTKHGKKYGIKNADTSMRLVMGGLATLDLNYIKKMKTWFEANRADKKFAVDALNFHIYAFKDGASWQGGGPAVSPEASGFREKMTEIVKYRNENLPGKEVWVSEFGWDTNPESVLAPPKIGAMDIYEIQAIWLIRAYLELAAAGVDRAQMYMSRDVNPNDKTWFATCGIMGPKGDFTPKKSWYYIYTMKNILKNMRYAGELKDTNPNIRIYKFSEKGSSKSVYAIWAKTSEDLKITNHPIQLGAKATAVSLTTPVNGKITGEEKTLSSSEGRIVIDVSEKPVFVLVNE
ncbi:hypothetical protein ABDK00_010195 [Niabella insulamsoli]|uniref:hypothetical protein n=1 Tax=Niabella insulamsoli TaxID=3144874 RepID=UPI0031FC5055